VILVVLNYLPDSYHVVTVSVGSTAEDRCTIGWKVCIKRLLGSGYANLSYSKHNPDRKIILNLFNMIPNWMRIVHNCYDLILIPSNIVEAADLEQKKGWKNWLF